MNWLAHLYLSEPDAEARLGNLLADFIKGRERQGLSPRMQHGIRCHQAIDAFTDYHPVVQRSKGRIGPEHRRFAGILIDIFYDHFLARNWACYTAMPLETFTGEVYQSLLAFAAHLPGEAGKAIQRIAAHDLLGSYQHLEGIEETLKRLSRRLAQRWQRVIALEEAIEDLRTHFDALESDFRDFFPQLQQHVKAWQQQNTR